MKQRIEDIVVCYKNDESIISSNFDLSEVTIIRTLMGSHSRNYLIIPLKKTTDC